MRHPSVTTGASWQRWAIYSESTESLGHAITGEKPHHQNAQGIWKSCVANLNDVRTWHDNRGWPTHNAYATFKPSTSTTKANMSNEIRATGMLHGFNCFVFSAIHSLNESISSYRLVTEAARAVPTIGGSLVATAPISSLFLEVFVSVLNSHWNNSNLIISLYRKVNEHNTYTTIYIQDKKAHKLLSWPFYRYFHFHIISNTWGVIKIWINCHYMQPYAFYHTYCGYVSK